MPLDSTTFEKVDETFNLRYALVYPNPAFPVNTIVIQKVEQRQRTIVLYRPLKLCYNNKNLAIPPEILYPPPKFPTLMQIGG